MLLNVIDRLSAGVRKQRYGVAERETVAASFSTAMLSGMLSKQTPAMV
jgi:hypothetical protein